MEKENNIIKMELLNVMAIMLMGKKKDMENIFGKMGNIILDNGLMIKNMEKEHYIIKMGT